MQCPACRQPLSEKEVITSDNQKALTYECFNCGGHFTPPLIANLIPLVTAQDLDSITPKNTYPSTQSVDCPVCHTTMVAISDSAVPRGVTVYSCRENHGNFFPLHQLFAFKKAQKSKLEYHQLWGIPLKSIFTVLLPIIAIFTAVTAIPFTLDQLKSSQESRIRAGEIVSTPLVTPIGPTQVVISFTTNVPTVTNLRLLSPGETTEYPISVVANATHVLNLSTLQPNTLYNYYLIIDGIEYGPYNFTTLSN